MDERQRARLLDDGGRARAALAGRGTPSRGRCRALWAFFLVLTGCALFGAHASFVPSPLWRGVGTALAAAVATLEDVVLSGPASLQRSTAGARRPWRCSRRLYLDTLSGALPAYVCGDPAGGALRAGTRIRIDGRASAFGLHVERVAALEAARD